MSTASFIISVCKHSHAFASSYIWGKLLLLLFYCKSSHNLKKTGGTKRRTLLYLFGLSLAAACTTCHACYYFLDGIIVGPEQAAAPYCGRKTYYPCTLAPLVFKLPSFHSLLIPEFLFGENPRQAAANTAGTKGFFCFFWWGVLLV